MVKIRLRRVGAKKQPSYRIVVADSRSPRDGRFIETIGSYNPRTEPETIRYKEDRALHWLSVGAQPTAAVARMLEKKGTMARFARLRAGEPLEALLAEAEAAAQAQPVVSSKTEAVPAVQEVVEKEALDEGELETEPLVEAPDQGEEETEAEAAVQAQPVVSSKTEAVPAVQEVVEKEASDEEELEPELLVEAPDQGEEETEA